MPHTLGNRTKPAVKMTPAAVRSRTAGVRCSARIRSLPAPDGTNQPELVKAQVLIYIQQVFPLKLAQPLVGASTVLYDLNSGHCDGFSEVATRLKGFRVV